MAYRYCEFLRRMHMLDRQPVSTRKKKVYKKRFNPLIELSEKDFRSIYRFSKRSMEKLIGIVRRDLEGDRRGGRVPVDLQVMAAIRYWGHNVVQGDAADTHGFSQPTLSIICTRVARAFASRAKQIITMPKTATAREAIVEKFKAISGFPDAIGAIGCTHVRIKKQGGENAQDFVNHKGYYSIKVQAVCDPNLKITDIACHLRGSTHASRIYAQSIIGDRIERGEFSGRLLGDSGYICTNHLFTPIQNPNSADTNYNVAHTAARSTIDRTFRILKSRFRILLTGMRGSLDKIKTTVESLCVLHNLAIEYNDVLDDENEEIDDDSDNDTSLPPDESQYLSDGDETSRTAFIGTYFT